MCAPLIRARWLRDRYSRQVMSWQAYVDSNLLASGMVTAAGIYDLQGNPWAYSAGFAVSTAPRAPALLLPAPRGFPVTLLVE